MIGQRVLTELSSPCVVFCAVARQLWVMPGRWTDARTFNQLFRGSVARSDSAAIVVVVPIRGDIARSTDVITVIFVLNSFPAIST